VGLVSSSGPLRAEPVAHALRVVTTSSEVWSGRVVHFERASSAGTDHVISILQCREINVRVRALFKPGGKSNNKLYAPAGTTHAVVLASDFFKAGIDVSGQSARFQRRLQQNQLSSENRVTEQQLRMANLKTELDFAEALFGLSEAGALSGNCSEMARVAAKLVHDDSPDVKSYLCHVGPPADHAFCLLAEAPIHEVPESIHDMCHAKLTQSTKWRVIDPWLNTACSGGTYHLNARDRLDKWTSAMKRVAWKGADQNLPGWYPPSGSYSQALMTSPLDLTPIAV
jgi:hypothetical protein